MTEQKSKAELLEMRRALYAHYEWLGGYTIITWLSEPNGHYDEHEQYIRAWLSC